MYRRTYLFSHNDLDGLACNVVARCYLEEETTELVEFNCSYQILEKKIRENLSEIDIEKDLVIVSDISWQKSSKELTNFFKACKNLVIADHHKSSEWINSEIHRDSVFVKEGEKCGCQILQDLLSKKIDIDIDIEKRLTEFTSMVSDWDLWTWVDGLRSMSFASVGNLMMYPVARLATWCEWCSGERSEKYFIDEMVTKITLIESTFKYAMEITYSDKDFKKFFHDTVKIVEKCSREYIRFRIPTKPESSDIEIDSLLFICPANCKHKSILAMVANARVEEERISDFDCISIWTEGDDNISLRFPKNGLDLSTALCNCSWGGGGHPEAAGTTPGKEYMRNIQKKSRIYRL